MKQQQQYCLINKYLEIWHRVANFLISYLCFCTLFSCSCTLYGCVKQWQSVMGFQPAIWKTFFVTMTTCSMAYLHLTTNHSFYGYYHQSLQIHPRGGCRLWPDAENLRIWRNPSRKYVTYIPHCISCDADNSVCQN